MSDGSSNVEGTYIRGLDVDKAVKGFALMNYVFKSDCTKSSTSSDSIRWYQEGSNDLTATAPSYVENISPLSVFPTLEVTWTRNTTYIRKYAAEGFLSMEDMASADVDVLARTLLRLTRAVIKKVDARIWNVMSQDRKNPATTDSTLVSSINMITSSGAWNLKSGCNPIQDIMQAKQMISISGGYNPEGASLYLTPTAYTYLVTWLIDTKGSSIPAFASEKIQSGTVMSILGVNIKVSQNVTTDYGLMVIPQTACTWKTHTDTTSRVIEEPGLGSKIRVWELGEAYLTDPKAICLISNVE